MVNHSHLRNQSWQVASPGVTGINGWVFGMRYTVQYIGYEITENIIILPKHINHSLKYSKSFVFSVILKIETIAGRNCRELCEFVDFRER